MGKVYFKAINSYSDTATINKWSAELLKKAVADENMVLEDFIPLKVHFGENGNTTFINPVNYNGIIDYLNENNIKSAFIETNVLYKGMRTTVKDHTALALSHGFTALPLIFADGDHGEDYSEIEINQKNFATCKIGKAIAESNQLIVLSHFKGHALAGFGGAIKQLGMGCASRGGKLAQHANSIPGINFLKCKACGACAKKCPQNAIIMPKKAKILKDKCVGCASCTTTCPYNAISFSWLGSLSKNFFERLAEYALAASKDKKNIYITFAFNITKNCDCEGHSMKPVCNDLGIFASTDPVAIDKACLDMLDKTNHKTVFRRGRYTLDYAEKIGLGSQNYEFEEL